MVAINAPHFYAAVIYNDNGQVVEAAPIIRYMTGWFMDQVEEYCNKKGWNIVQND